MTKKELIRGMANAAGSTFADAERMYSFLVTTIRQELLFRGRVEVDGIGVFRKVTRAPRQIKCFGKTVKSQQHNTVIFRPGPAVKEAVN